MILPIKQKLKFHQKHQSLSGYLDAVSWNTIEKLAFLTIILMLILPMLHVISCTLNDKLGICRVFYYANFNYAFKIMLVINGITMFLFIGKSVLEKYTLRQYFKDHPPMKYFIPYLICILISTCINDINRYTLQGGPVSREGLLVVLSYIFMFFFSASIIEKKKLKGILEYTFTIGGLLLALCEYWCIYVKMIHFLVNFAIGTDLIVAVFTNSNHYAYYMAMIVTMSGCLFILEKNKPLKYLNLINFIANGWLLIINDTFGAYLAVLFGCVFLVTVISIVNKKFTAAALIPLALFLIMTLIINSGNSVISNSITEVTSDLQVAADSEDYYFEESSTLMRSKLIEVTLDCIRKKPLFGYGNEGVMDILVDATGVEPRTYNEYLERTVSFGIPAGILFVIGAFSVFWKGLRFRRSIDKYTICALSGAFTYLVSSFVGTSLYYTAPYLFIFLGLGLTGKKHK